VIGPGREYEDPFGEWALLREVEEAGAVLVRPDMMVAWCALDAAPGLGEAEDQLSTALAGILGRAQTNTVTKAA
jgi:2,4-dichlorophenol 6-monooxygenase